MKISLRLSLFMAMFSMLSSFASAAVWSGGGIDNIASDPVNWTPAVQPTFVDDIIFDSTTTKDCTWDLNESVLSLSIEGGYSGSLTVISPLILSNGFAGGWNDCTGYTYSDWGTCTNGSQSRTVTGYTPSDCSGTPSDSPVLTQPCDPIVLLQNNEYALTLAAKQTQAFLFTTPTGGCSTALHKWLKIDMINVDLTKGDGQLLVKSSNQGASSWPTLEDYTYEFGINGYSNGQDWTRDPNGGVFFWNWSIGQASECLAILPSYTGHTFNQDDTYYLLLYNQGTTSNQYRVLWQCY